METLERQRIGYMTSCKAVALKQKGYYDIGYQYTTKTHSCMNQLSNFSNVIIPTFIRIFWGRFPCGHVHSVESYNSCLFKAISRQRSCDISLSF